MTKSMFWHIKDVAIIDVPLLQRASSRSLWATLGQISPSAPPFLIFVEKAGLMPGHVCFFLFKTSFADSFG